MDAEVGFDNIQAMCLCGRFEVVWMAAAAHCYVDVFSADRTPVVLRRVIDRRRDFSAC